MKIFSLSVEVTNPRSRKGTDSFNSVLIFPGTYLTFPDNKNTIKTFWSVFVVKNVSVGRITLPLRTTILIFSNVSYFHDIVKASLPFRPENCVLGSKPSNMKAIFFSHISSQQSTLVCDYLSPFPWLLPVCGNNSGLAGLKFLFVVRRQSSITSHTALRMMLLVLVMENLDAILQ